MMSLEDIQALTYAIASLPRPDEPDSVEFGHTIPAEFFGVVIAAMKRHVAAVDNELSYSRHDKDKRYRLLAVRGFTYAEFQVLFNTKVSIDQFEQYPIFEVLMLGSEQMRRDFINLLDTDEISYLKALQKARVPILASFFSPLPARLRVGDLLKHCYISGQSGSGKSELLKLLWYHLQEISQHDRKHALMLLDPHGDLSREALALHLNKDHDRVVYIDPFFDASHFPVLNPLEISDRSLPAIDIYAQSLARVFQELIPTSEMTMQMQTLLIPCIATLLYSGNRTLKDLQAFMQNDPALIALGRNSPFPAHREFFNTAFVSKSYETTKAGIYTRIQSLLNNDGFYRITCGKSTVDLEQAINAGKIIIVRFTKNRGEEASRAFNKMIIALLQSIVLKRADLPKGQRKPLFLFIDEFQTYLSPSIGTILEESRKFGLHLIIANQNLGQIDDKKLLRTILSNAYTKIVGANGHKDLKDLSDEISVPIKQMQLLSKYQFYVKSGNNSAYTVEPNTYLLEQTPPFYLSPEKAGELREWIIEVSGQYKPSWFEPDQPENDSDADGGGLISPASQAPPIPTATKGPSGKKKMTPKFKI
ncbi:MAG: type IV secretion system DNA-binding domain-containing protein [Bacteroidota bacterium]